MASKLTAKDRQEISRAVDVYIAKMGEVETVAKTIHGYLVEAESLRSLVHSYRYRVKDPDHLRDKLERKALAARSEGKTPSITSNNIFEKIGDLSGIRILYLRPSQIREILPETIRVLSNWGCLIAEDPFAYTWDDETREIFQSMNVPTQYRPELYTSVHFVTKFNKTHFCRCEVQLRTLMEEVWGEVSHTVNYPHSTNSIACKEQLKVLARVASGGTRLVDSIFASLEEYRQIATPNSPTNRTRTITSRKKKTRAKKTSSKKK